MSMEERTEKFHTDAQRPKDKNTPKDIDKLKKFLFKNQAHRFTDREQSHLFQAIQLYVTMYTANPEPDSPALALVEDALKMWVHPVPCDGILCTDRSSSSSSARACDTAFRNNADECDATVRGMWELLQQQHSIGHVHPATTWQVP